MFRQQHFHVVMLLCTLAMCACTVFFFKSPQPTVRSTGTKADVLEAEMQCPA